MIFDWDHWNEIFITVKNNRLRSFLTAFGVFWGMFMLVVMLGAGNGLRNGVMKEFDSLAVNSVFVWSQNTTVPYKGLPAGRWIRLNTDDIKAIQSGIPELKHIAPRNQLGGFQTTITVTRKDKSNAFNVYGDYPEILNIQLMDMVAGRFINELDLKERRKVAVIGKRVYKLLFEKKEDPIGKHILIRGVWFQVIGVFMTRSTGSDAEEKTQSVFIPFTTFSQAFNFGDNVRWFSMIPVKGIAASVLEKRVITTLKRRHHIAPKDKHALGHWNAEKEYNKLQGLFTGVNMLFWFVGTLTLTAGIIGVSNIMLIVIRERTREIGIRRAIGATPLRIIAQIIMEALLLTLLAGYSGLVAGIGLLEIVSYQLNLINNESIMIKNPFIDFPTGMSALVILVLSGILAGLLPAKKAVEIKPVEAIRNE